MMLVCPGERVCLLLVALSPIIVQPLQLRSHVFTCK